MPEYRTGDTVRITATRSDAPYMRRWLGLEFTVESTTSDPERLRLDGPRPDGIVSPFMWSASRLELVDRTDYRVGDRVVMFNVPGWNDADPERNATGATAVIVDGHSQGNYEVTPDFDTLPTRIQEIWRNLRPFNWVGVQVRPLESPVPRQPRPIGVGDRVRIIDNLPRTYCIKWRGREAEVIRGASLNGYRMLRLDEDRPDYTSENAPWMPEPRRIQWQTQYLERIGGTDA